MLRIRRTLSGEEIDNIIATTVAGFELAAEQAKRREWQQRVANASQFNSAIFAEINYVESQLTN